jgi:imidazole glycerol-phosphate synthase subunit HisH
MNVQDGDLSPLPPSPQTERGENQKRRGFPPPAPPERNSSDRIAQRVTVVDTGVGNLGNLLRALDHLGADATLSADPAEVAAARCLVLPGVGAFRPPRERLRGPLEAGLRAALEGGAYLLGICVGYQLLFASSSEFGDTDGLGLLGGRIDALPAGVALPHIGWNRLVERREHPLLAGLPPEAYVYFVHSYAPLEVPEEQVLARAVHGVPFVAVAGAGRVFGCQFHPEKSGSTGLRLLANFLSLEGEKKGTLPPAPLSADGEGGEPIREGVPPSSSPGLPATGSSKIGGA